jgi:hypothetical protein
MKRNLAWVSCIATGFFLLIPACHAENGTVELIFAGNANVYSVEMEDTTVSARGGTGTFRFLRSSGAPVAGNERGSLQYVSFSKKSSIGFQLESDGVATFSAEDTLFFVLNQHSADVGAGRPGEGTLQLTGGTGRFSGIKGQCRYAAEELPESSNVTKAQCDWSYSFPYR